VAQVHCPEELLTGQVQCVMISHPRFLAKGIDLGEQIDLILLDFSKAFDKVPHKRLLYKAEYYGISGSTLWWIRDFLSS
jgi:hypothetical protein